MNGIKVIENNPDKPFAVIYKESGIPSAPLKENDTENALYMTSKLIPEILNVKGIKEIEYGLIHRIDNVTKGLLLFAKTQEFYDYIIEQQKLDRFAKIYEARCNINGDSLLEGFPPVPGGVEVREGASFTISSYFRHYGKNKSEVRPVTQNSNPAALKKLGTLKLYSTVVNIIKIEKNEAIVRCKLTQGFKHQVRAHLAWIGLPIVNDEVYGIKKAVNPIEFTACGLQFEYPEGDLNSYDCSLGPEPSASTNSAIGANS